MGGRTACPGRAQALHASRVRRCPRGGCGRGSRPPGAPQRIAEHLRNAGCTRLIDPGRRSARCPRPRCRRWPGTSPRGADLVQKRRRSEMSSMTVRTVRSWARPPRSRVPARGGVEVSKRSGPPPRPPGRRPRGRAAGAGRRATCPRPPRLGPGDAQDALVGRVHVQTSSPRPGRRRDDLVQGHARGLGLEQGANFFSLASARAGRHQLGHVGGDADDPRATCPRPSSSGVMDVVEGVVVARSCTRPLSGHASRRQPSSTGSSA